MDSKLRPGSSASSPAAAGGAGAVRRERAAALPHEPGGDAAAVRDFIGAVCAIQHWAYGRYWQVDPAAGILRAGADWAEPGSDGERVLTTARALTLAPSVGIAGRAWQAGRPLWESDLPPAAPDEVDPFAGDSTVAGAGAFPVACDGAIVGVLTFASGHADRPDQRLLQTLGLAVEQLGQVLQHKQHADELLRFRAALDISADSIWLIDRDTMRFIDVNRTACERFGYTREELLTMGPRDLSPEQGQSFPVDYDHIIAGDTTPTISERTLRHKDGTLIPIEARRVAVKSGERWIIVGIARDLTDRVAADRALRESNEGFRTLAEAMPQIGWVCEPDGSCIYMNRRWVDDTGLPVASSVGHGWLDAIHPDDRPGCLASWQHSLDTGEPYEDEFRVCRADGSYRWMLSRGLPMRNDDGEVRKWFGTWTDIDSQKRAERTIRKHAMQQNLIATFGQKALAKMSLDDLLKEAVAAAVEGLEAEFCAFLQRSAEERSYTLAAGAGWRDEWLGWHIPEAEDDAESGHPDSHTGLPETRVKQDLQLDSGTLSPEIIAAHDIRSGIEIAVSGVAGAYGLITVYSRTPSRFSSADADFLSSLANTLATAIDRHDAEQRLTYLAQFDALTDLPNRRLFLDRVAQTLPQAQRTQSQVAILFADLDQFKAVNDTLGHGPGDQLLVQVAQRLLRCTRTSDTVARLSGDEFAVMLVNLTRNDDVMLVAQKIVETLAKPFELDGEEARISVSLGIALYPDDGHTAEALLKNADTAMYRAKARGRNSYQFYLPQMNERAGARLCTEHELRDALERGEFALCYQPEMDLASGEFCGLDVLLEWQHPCNGRVPADEFMSVLEDTGLIVAVGGWMIGEVCRQLGRWSSRGARTLPVAVSVSARQFAARQFAAEVETLLLDAAVEPGLLELELTEATLMSDPEAVGRTLNALQTLGVKVSADDFGSGCSSLAFLQRLPLTALKIDRAFIRHVGSRPDDAVIMRAIIDLAHGLNLQAVAKGVETAEQWEFIRAHGCDTAQGHYISVPLDADSCLQLLRTGCAP
ncbi:MAG: EAL domain-containing protein [Gammaproteobacteria bacterium]